MHPQCRHCHANVPMSKKRCVGGMGWFMPVRRSADVAHCHERSAMFAKLAACQQSVAKRELYLELARSWATMAQMLDHQVEQSKSMSSGI